MRRIHQPSQSHQFQSESSLFRPSSNSATIINTGYSSKSTITSTSPSNRISSASPPSSSSQQLLNHSWPLDCQQKNKMAGDIRMVDRKKPRKSWILQDRCSMNVHLLKANLAEEGCEVSQLDLAKKHLDSADESQGEAVAKENSRLAVYWLIKSAEQGNEEARELLIQCLKSGQGINCQNIADVRTCINTPKNEKLVFKGAKLLYEKCSNGEEFITTSQILDLVHAKKCTSQKQLGETFTGNSDVQSTGVVTGGEEQESLDKTFIVEDNNSECDASTFSQSGSNAKTKNQNNNNIMETNMSMKQDGVKLTKDDLMKIATSYNNGEIPQVVIDSQTEESSVLQAWKLFSHFHGFFLQFLLLSLLTKALTLHSVLIIIASWLTLWTCYNYYSWQRRLAVFEDWKLAFKTALEKNSQHNIDISNEKKLKSKQIQPLNVTNLTCLCVLFAFSCPPPILLFLSLLTIVGIYRGILYRSSSSRNIGLIVILTVTGSSVFTKLRQEEALFTTTLFSDEYLKSFLPLDDIEIVPKVVKDYGGEWLSYLDVKMVLVIISLFLIFPSYLRNRVKNESNSTSHLLEQVILLLWLLQLDRAIVSLNLSEITGVLGITIIFSTLFYLLEFSKDIWTFVRRAIGFMTLIMLIVMGALVISKTFCAVDENITDNEDSYNGNIDGNDEVTRINWDQYSENCHRKAWEKKTIQETQLYCSLKYAVGIRSSLPTLISWNGRISSIKVSNIAQQSLLVMTPEISQVSFEILVNVESTLTPYEGQSWLDLARGGATPDNEVKNIVLMHISTKDILGSQVRAQMLEDLLRFRVGDSVVFHGSILRGAGGIKPEVGKITKMRCVDCALMPENSSFSFASESYVLDWLNPFEEYLGDRFIQFLGAIEYNLKYYVKTTVKYLRSLL